MISGEGISNHKQYSIDVFYHFIIPKPQHTPTRLFELHGARGIINAMRISGMLPTI